MIPFHGLAQYLNILPPEFDLLRASELADQIESLKITPQTLSMDDMSKLWTAFQASYRTTVAYDVSLVLIDRDMPVQPSLNLQQMPLFQSPQAKTAIMCM